MTLLPPQKNGKQNCFDIDNTPYWCILKGGKKQGEETPLHPVSLALSHKKREP